MSSNGYPSRHFRSEYVPRSPRTATKVHKVRKYEEMENILDEEVEEALRIHNTYFKDPESRKLLEEIFGNSD